jgi:hypothetical protein
MATLSRTFPSRKRGRDSLEAGAATPVKSKRARGGAAATPAPATPAACDEPAPAPAAAPRAVTPDAPASAFRDAVRVDALIKVRAPPPVARSALQHASRPSATRLPHSHARVAAVCAADARAVPRAPAARVRAHPRPQLPGLGVNVRLGGRHAAALPRPLVQRRRRRRRRQRRRARGSAHAPARRGGRQRRVGGCVHRGAARAARRCAARPSPRTRTASADESDTRTTRAAARLFGPSLPRRLRRDDGRLHRAPPAAPARAARAPAR